MMRPAGENLQSIQGKALAEVAPRPNMRAEYASLLRPGWRLIPSSRSERTKEICNFGHGCGRLDWGCVEEVAATLPRFMRNDSGPPL
jgi:hypothetical protein